MAEPLATDSDVAERLGRDLTSDELARIGALLSDVSAAVRSYAGQTFTQEETAALLPIRNRAVRLPQKPVTAVASVEDGLGNALVFTWLTGDDRIALASSSYLNAWELYIRPSGTRLAKALVTYTHGYETTPDDVLGVVCSVVGRALGVSPTQAGITSESITNYSYTIGSAAAQGPFGLMIEEKKILDRYRTLAGPIPMM